VKNYLSNKDHRKNMITYLVVIVAFAIAEALRSGGSLSNTASGMLIPICVYISLAISLNLVVGISGELSLGHAGFMCVGVFTGIVAAAVFQNSVTNDVVRLILAMFCGGIMAGIFGFIVGAPVTRLSGDYLAIVTLAFGEILKNIIGNLYVGLDSDGLHFALLNAMELQEGGQMLISGAKGATGITKIATFPMAFVLVLFTLFVVLNLVNSKEGRAIKAVRDNRIAAESVGINVTAFRMKAFVVSAFLAGMAGALYGLNISAITASKFNFTLSINILVYVVLGGMGNILGSVIAAAVVYILPEALRGLYDYRMIIYAVVLIVVMLFTWSPSAKNAFAAFTGRLKGVFLNLISRFKEKEKGGNQQ
jgi:branched-chain amino acid transport system permease protein